MESWRRDMPPSVFPLSVCVRLTPGSSSLRGLLDEAQEPGSYKKTQSSRDWLFPHLLSHTGCRFYLPVCRSSLGEVNTPGPCPEPPDLAECPCVPRQLVLEPWQAAGQSARKSNSLGSPLNQWLPGVSGETPQPPFLLAGDMSEVYTFQLPRLDKAPSPMSMHLLLSTFPCLNLFPTPLLEFPRTTA